MKPHHIELLIPSEQVAARISTMANEITRALPKDLMVIALLRGSFVFTADLIRAFYASGTTPQVDFMTLESYGSGISSSGRVTVIRDITENVEGRDVLLVDDILESGRTLAFAKKLIKERKPRSVNIAVMLEKPGKRKVEIDADFVGFAIGDKFVVGMGLDYANFYRELPYIGAVAFDD
ncbi:MAG: hypoxanthine phosphoribosyltransferase [Alphaproteobacteria bacterium]|nr:hypoxanthine phosphoribosyltransferase [Alphaproteobacteria bacterium]